MMTISVQKPLKHTAFYHTVYHKYSEKKTKKSYTTPGKELAKKERRIKKLEEQITVLEADTAALQNELNNPANALDYKKLEELQNTLNIKENELFEVMSEWDALMNQ